VRLYQSISAVYATVGLTEKAADVYKVSLEIEPDNPGTYMGMASIYAKSGQIEEAIKNYEKLFELKPDAGQIMKIYADLLRDNGKKREALEMYKRSLEFYPTFSPALFNAGILSAKFGDLDSARIYLQTLKSVDPPLAKTLDRFLRLKN
jgi:tetratricopeptide (TPR) repeat protein